MSLSLVGFVQQPCITTIELQAKERVLFSCNTVTYLGIYFNIQATVSINHSFLHAITQNTRQSCLEVKSSILVLQLNKGSFENVCLNNKQTTNHECMQLFLVCCNKDFIYIFSHQNRLSGTLVILTLFQMVRTNYNIVI